MDEVSNTYGPDTRKAPKVIQMKTDGTPIGADVFSTEATLLAVSAQIPTTLGQKAMAASLAVALASDQSAIPVTQSIASTSTAPTGITVGLTAVPVKAANASRKRLICTNNGTSNLYFGKDNTVTISGATMGLLVIPGGVYDDLGPGLWQGDVYAVGDAALTFNCAVQERT